MDQFEQFGLNLPPMRMNPFHGQPLERHQLNLFSGRKQLLPRLIRHITFQSPRMILLKGERGSGRTSLIHAISTQSSRCHAMNFLPYSDHTTVILNQMFTSIVGFDVPNQANQLVEQVIEMLAEQKGNLPLISFDFPGASGSVLAELMQRLCPTLRRFRALVIVTVTPAQMNAFPEELVEEFDSIEELKVFDEKELQELIAKRMDGVCREGWALPNEIAPRIIDQTGGHVGRIVKLLRDLVDHERGETQIDQNLMNLHLSVQMHRESAEDQPEPNFEDSEVEENDILVKDRLANILDEEEPEPIEFSLSMFDDETITDLEDVNDEEFEIKTEWMDDGELGPPVTGMFGALASRNRISSSTLSKYQHDTERPALDETFLPPTETMRGAELWISDDKVETKTQSSMSSPIPVDTTIDISTAEIENVNVDQTHGLIERLTSMRPNQGIGERESLALDVESLRNLSDRDALLVASSAIREFSPSDQELGEHMAVTRARLSQLCNSLHRKGILSVRKDGRTRLFKLSNDARAQMIAWGYLEE